MSYYYRATTTTALSLAGLLITFSSIWAQTTTRPRVNVRELLFEAARRHSLELQTQDPTLLQNDSSQMCASGGAGPMGAKSFGPNTLEIQSDPLPGFVELILRNATTNLLWELEEKSDLMDPTLSWGFVNIYDNTIAPTNTIYFPPVAMDNVLPDMFFRAVSGDVVVSITKSPYQVSEPCGANPAQDGQFYINLDRTNSRDLTPYSSPRKLLISDPIKLAGHFLGSGVP